MKISEKIKFLRSKKGVTLTDVQNETGISSGYLSRLERGEMENPSLEKLKIIADYYDVSIAYLLAGDDGWKKLLPPGIREFVGEENIKYLKVIKKAKSDGWSPDAIIELMNIIKDVKKDEKQ